LRKRRIALLWRFAQKSAMNARIPARRAQFPAELALKTGDEARRPARQVFPVAFCLVEVAQA